MFHQAIYKIVQVPNPKLIYYPVTRNELNRMRVWLTDQDNKPVDLRGEELTVRITVREVRDLHNLIRGIFCERSVISSQFD